MSKQGENKIDEIYLFFNIIYNTDKDNCKA